MARVLWWISDNARLCLIIGLAMGLGLPKLAWAMQPWLPHMVAGLLVITALRIGHRAATGALKDLKWGVGSVAILQIAVPVSLLGICTLMGLAQSPVAMAIVLATAAPAVSGSPNLALLLGQDAGWMMQILVLGTACFPLTILPIFALMPHLGTPADVATAALRLLAVILISAGVGFGLRARFLPRPSDQQVKTLDGLSVLAFSAIVIGLMAALTPGLRTDPMAVIAWGLVAFALSYGLQIITYISLRRSRHATLAGPLAIGAGNRNIALFLIALPPDVIAPIMVFIGCWQLPMYLTPIFLRRLYSQGV